MSDVRDPETDQVAPTPNDKPAVWLEVIADMQKRNEHGTKKYGTPLQPNNGRNAMRDLYEELLDAAVYAKQKMLEEPDSLAGRLRAKVAEWRKMADDMEEQHPKSGPAEEIGAMFVAMIRSLADGAETLIEGPRP